MTTRGALPAALAAALLLPAAARAESRPEEAVTPLGLLRRAEVVAVVTGVPPAPGQPGAGAGEAGTGNLGVLRLDEVLRGKAAAGELVPLTGVATRDDVRAAPGMRAVAFLVRRGDGTREVLGGALGLVGFEDVPAGDPPAVALFRDLVASLGKDGKIADPARARAALVAAATDPADRLRSGAAQDLLREPGLLDGAPGGAPGGATGEERAALGRAFDALPNGDRARAPLARILGRLRPADAAARLAGALLEPDGDVLAEAVGAALADLGDPKAIDLLSARSADPTPRARRLVAKALGATGSPAARPGLESLLGAAEPEVRMEAVVGLGCLRAAAAAPALLRRFLADAGTPAPEGDAVVRRALAWALAQCDEPDAWRALEAASRDEGDPGLRRFAADTLADPRRPFVK
jgi:HEAT repeat protein